MDNRKKSDSRYAIIWHEAGGGNGVDMGVFCDTYYKEKDARDAIFSAIMEDMNTADEEGAEFTVDFSQKPVISTKAFGKVTHYKVEEIDA